MRERFFEGQVIINYNLIRQNIPEVLQRVPDPRVDGCQQAGPHRGLAELPAAAAQVLPETQAAPPSPLLLHPHPQKGYLHQTGHHGRLSQVPSRLDAFLQDQAVPTATGGRGQRGRDLVSGGVEYSGRYGCSGCGSEGPQDTLRQFQIEVQY